MAREGPLGEGCADQTVTVIRPVGGARGSPSGDTRRPRPATVTGLCNEGCPDTINSPVGEHAQERSGRGEKFPVEWQPWGGNIAPTRLSNQYPSDSSVTTRLSNDSRLTLLAACVLGRP
jgi:hypothetical protein